jgi:hypothetical protein
MFAFSRRKTAMNKLMILPPAFLKVFPGAELRRGETYEAILDSGCF